MRPSQKRADDRRKILGERNVATVGGGATAHDESVFSSHNFSLASAGSYTDFQVSFWMLYIYTYIMHVYRLDYV